MQHWNTRLQKNYLCVTFVPTNFVRKSLLDHHVKTIDKDKKYFQGNY